MSKPQIHAVLAAIGGITFNVIRRSTTTEIPPHLSPKDIIVEDPLEFLDLINPGSVRPAAPTATPDFNKVVAKRAVAVKPARVQAASKKWTRDDGLYRAPMTTGNGPSAPKLAFLRLTVEDVAKIQKALNDRDNALSPTQRFILTHHLGLNGNPARTHRSIAFDLFPQEMEGTTSKTDKVMRQRVQRDEHAALKMLEVFHRRRRRRRRRRFDTE